jgi:hypothetical protein
VALLEQEWRIRRNKLRLQLCPTYRVRKLPIATLPVGALKELPLDSPMRRAWTNLERARQIADLAEETLWDMVKRNEKEADKVMESVEAQAQFIIRKAMFGDEPLYVEDLLRSLSEVAPLRGGEGP